MRTPLQKGEKILLVTYCSWVRLIGPALIVIAGFVISYFIGFTTNYGWIVALVGILWFLIKYWSWKVNLWAVTSLRVVDENGLLSHHAKESPLEKINNVSYDQNIWGRIFNYGHVEIQTAAEIGATDYFSVHGPKRLRDTIMQAQSDLEQNKFANQAHQMAEAMRMNMGSGNSTSISTELQQLYELKQKGILTEEEYNRAKKKLLG